MKIYTDDPLLEYKTTKLPALHSRHEIDGLFAKYGIKKTAWNWNIEQNEVYVIFELEESIEEGKPPIKLSARVDAYPIWDHEKRNKVEEINWDVTMRQMLWFLKTHLQASYVRQTSKAVAFLSYIQTKDSNIGNIVIQRIDRLNDFEALVDQRNEEKRQRLKVNPIAGEGN